MVVACTVHCSYEQYFEVVDFINPRETRFV